VPMIARLPGRIEAGAVNATPGYFADWFPTLCEAAELEPPAGLDGESLWPVLTGMDTPGPLRPMLWVFPEYGGQVAVRVCDFKLVRRNLNSKAPGPWEVYNLSEDPAEERDLAASRANLIVQVEAILRREVSANAHFPVPIPGIPFAPR